VEKPAVETYNAYSMETCEPINIYFSESIHEYSRNQIAKAFKANVDEEYQEDMNCYWNLNSGNDILTIENYNDIEVVWTGDIQLDIMDYAGNINENVTVFAKIYP